jgi:CheY-like chemotaxis protein
MLTANTNRSILVIDDEPDLCRIVKVTLERLEHWKIFTVESMQAGLFQAQTKQPDAILLDLSLSDGDGMELLQALKTNPMTRSIPVILFTAKDPSEHSREIRLGEVAGVILKPFNVLQLADQIVTQLGW